MENSRKILFRGLSIKENKWVYGGYFQHTPDEDGVRYYIFDFNEGAVEVIPESVGQFTGLHDKNGKEIYEQMELNNIFIIKWLNFRYVLFYISNLTTFEEIFDYENKLEITREYTEL